MPRTLLVVLPLLISFRLYAAEYDRVISASLVSLPPVVIVVECGQELPEAGFACSDVETAVREHLQNAHVALREPDAPKDPKSPPPFLTIRISSARLVQNHSVQLFAITVRADLIQGVEIPRLGPGLHPASTWNTQRTELLGSGRLKDITHDTVLLLDDFIRDYRATAPR